MDAELKMCGIAGELRFDGNKSDLAITRAMCDAQIHRGPDDDGYYAHGPVSLGIRRLSIIDLTKGLYPLQNESGTIHLVFNGEIYGFHALRSELQERRHRFRSKTDAETLVHGYEEWGTKCLDRLNGMFAFALWDDREQLLWIARDHFGIKPLYYHQSKEMFTFASEIKPLLARPDVHARPNERVIQDYLYSARVDDTADTFFDGIKRLLPAHCLLIQPSGTIRLERYWTPKISRRLNDEASADEAENTRRLFLEAINRQLVSDVPVGTCLSGGIDSSSVVSAIRKVHPKGSTSTGEWIKTFSAIFPGYPIDESRYVREVCEAAQAEYNPVEPSADDLWRDLPDLVRCQEEPFLSTSIYAQYRVMKRARERGVTVLLDGQGGDELLCGYIPLYLHYLLMLRKHGMYHRLLVEGIRSIDLIGPLLKLLVLKRLLTYWRSVAFGTKTKAAAIGREDAARKPSEDDLPGILELLTSVHGLPALLRYEDKNSMWHSVEARVPFLDRPFFEHVASLPLNRKLQNGWTKYIFRLAMRDVLPEKILLRRSKIGFSAPEKEWMQELREKLNSLLSGPDLAVSKYVDGDALRRLTSKRTPTDEEANQIFRITNVELWYREFFSQRSN